MRNLRKILVVANLILVPTAAAIPDNIAKVFLAVAAGCNSAAAYLLKEGD